MKAIAVCLGALFALAANADDGVRAKLVGQRIVSNPGTPILICQYLGPDAKYEVVAASEKCAPYFRLSDESELRRSTALAKNPSP